MNILLISIIIYLIIIHIERAKFEHELLEELEAMAKVINNNADVTAEEIERIRGTIPKE